MQTPAAIYRIQINPDFGFKDVEAVLGYLSSLGISHIYAGPIFKARPGSKHGYDITDPNSLNPELGSEEDFRRLISEKKHHGLGWIQDIVPNHMALDSHNAMLMDVLENFDRSEFFQYFDIAWDFHPDTSEPRLTLPLLGDSYAECLSRGEIRLAVDDKGMAVLYKDLRLPLRLSSYTHVLKAAAGPDASRPAQSGIVRLLHLFENLGEAYHHQEGARVKGEFLKLYGSDADVRRCLDAAIEKANTGGGDTSEPGVLEGLLKKQVFRLVHWRTGSGLINYRRFFNVNRLISLRMESPPVFEHHHRLIAKWLFQGVIDGLRVDHVDGLYDAHGYLGRLRAVASDAYVVVEKILSPDETLSPHWDVQGTTGYDFLNHVNGVFCMQANADKLESVYRGFTGISDTYDDMVYENKRMIVETHFQAAMERLAWMAGDLLSDIPDLSPTGHEGLKRALMGFAACFPVYRTYIGPRPPHPADSRRIEEAAEEAERRNPDIGRDLHALKHLILAAVEELEDSGLSQSRVPFLRTLQQYTGPIMAKGFEDTVLYIYNRLLSLNEVGGEPRDFGVSLEDFHAFNQRRLMEWPHSMSATSTHDTKRGEDVRARINVLSEIPDDFGERIRRWRELNAPHAGMEDGMRVPNPNDEYFLYQTLLGAYPFLEEERAGFIPRLKAYMIKAMREAKSLTSWAEPDTAYENGFTGFMKAILDPAVAGEFLDDFSEFSGRIHRYGVYNSLSQTILKLTSPGVPDFYQGSEIWDLNLVDPDNRRPVDFGFRNELLKTLTSGASDGLPGLVRGLLLEPHDGAVKIFLIQKALAARRASIGLFTEGAYVPLYAEGELRNHIICFVRRSEGHAAIVIAPRFFTSLVEPEVLPIGNAVWKDTRVRLPDGFPAEWKDAITDKAIVVEGELKIGDALTDFPVALLMSA